MLATKQSLPHTPGTYGQQQYNPAEGTSGLLLQPPSLAILPTRPIRVRPTQSERSGQRINACERLFPLRSNSSRDDENHPISGRSPPRKGHPREKMPLSPTKATAGSHCASSRWAPSCSFAPNQQKKRRSPDQPALSFLSFANAFLALFARGNSRTTSGAVRTCERLFGKARPPWSGSSSRSERSPTPVDAPHLGRLSPPVKFTPACARRARCWCAASSRPCQCRSHLRGRPRARTSPPRAALRRARRSAGFRRPRQASRRPEAP